MSLRIAILLLALPFAAAAQTVYQWKDKDGAVNYADQPPPRDVTTVREKRLGGGNYVETSAPSFTAAKAQKDFPVTLYTAAGCDADCKTARDFLARRGIPYTEASVAGKEAETFKRVFGGEEILVPSVTVGSQKQKGFEESAWTRLLDDAGYPKFSAGGSARTTPPAPKGQ